MNDNDIVTLDDFINTYKEKLKNIQTSTPKELRTRTPMRTNQLIDKEFNEILDQDNFIKGRTCLCTDEKMMLHYNLLDP